MLGHSNQKLRSRNDTNVHVCAPELAAPTTNSQMLGVYPTCGTQTEQGTMVRIITAAALVLVASSAFVAAWRPVLAASRSVDGIQRMRSYGRPHRRCLRRSRSGSQHSRRAAPLPG